MKALVAVILCSLILIGCSSNKKKTEPMDLTHLEELSQSKLSEDKEAAKMQIRMDALRDTAASLGARSGLAWRTKQINESLNKKVDYLDRVFDFKGLLLNDSVLPPVLVESRNSLNMESPHSLRVADRTYRIVKQARFTTTPPVWRDYLLMNAQKPEVPDSSLLPKNSKERSVWVKEIREGWNHGVEQANQIYIENLNRLKRDYQGMIRYRILLAQNMVSAPQVAKRDLGVTGGGDELSVNDRILTIKSLPALKADTKQWQPAITK